MLKSLLNENMRNKIKFISLLTAGLLFVSQTGIVLAEDSTSTTIPTTPPTTTTHTETFNPPQTPTTRDQSKLKSRQTKSMAVKKVAENQLSRAQNTIDKLQGIIDRLKAYRAKLTGSESDLAAVDALIATAESQKQTAVLDLSDVKAKALALQSALGVDSSTTTATAPTQQVKDLQTSVKTLKKQLISLHRTLQQIIKLMRSIEKPKTTTTTTPPPTPTLTPNPTSTNTNNSTSPNTSTGSTENK
jgi:hypothetical protein